MEIKGLQKTTLLDFPERVACIVFLPGCNFRCPFCHNPDLVSNADDIPSIPEKDIMDFLDRRSATLDGVVVTGGEPTLQSQLPVFIHKIKSKGLEVKLDTNGTNPDMLQELVDGRLLDYIAMDIKAPLAKYEKTVMARVDIAKVKQSISIIRDCGVEYEFRSTIVPKLHSQDDVMQMGKELNGSRRFALQQFKPEVTLDASYREMVPYPVSTLKDMAKALKPFFGEVILRT